MKYYFFCLLLFYLVIGRISAQDIIDNPTFDHKIFVDKLKNSQQMIYDNIIKLFDDYLSTNPDDVFVQVEKCKFVQIAQYDSDEEYNPNQEYFDSCSTALFEKYPNHPDVLLYHSTLLWGIEQKQIFEKSIKSIQENPVPWSNSNLSQLYFAIANQQYYDENYSEAKKYMDKACYYNEQYKSSIENAQILVMLKMNKEALTALLLGKDTTKNLWELSQKADLLLQLNDFKYAIKLYNLIKEIDSTYINNSDLAKAFEGVKQDSLARKYLVADTTSNWNPESALLKLFLFDLNHQNGDTCLNSYNAYRNLGYSSDPLGIYRLKLFFAHPLLAWKFRDFLGLLATLLLLVIAIMLPSIWILPIYVIGHKWKIIDKTIYQKYNWGLKSFWWVSTGYLIAMLGIVYAIPKISNSIISSNSLELTDNELGLYMLTYIIIFALFGFSVLYKVNLKVFLPANWPTRKSIGVTLLSFAIFKTISVIHILIGTRIFHYSLNDISIIPNTLLSTNAEINTFLSVYGNGLGILLFAFLVPIYEEIVFRGVILESCQRYLTFKWANIIQATLFAALHNNLFLFPLFLGFGLITGVLKQKSGGLIPGIAFHIINNTLVILIMISRS